MSYIVVYQRADGSSGVEECSDLDLAVVAAERLRNVDSVESPRIFKTEEVHFDFRPYYRVEVAAESAPAPTPIPPQVSAPAPAPESLDPWAQVEADQPVADVTPLRVPETVVVDASDAIVNDEVFVEATTAHAGAPVISDIDDEIATASADVFSTDHLPDPPPNLPAPPTDLDSAQDLADDVNDAVPPRRGLFGR